MSDQTSRYRNINYYFLVGKYFAVCQKVGILNETGIFVMGNYWSPRRVGGFRKERLLNWHTCNHIDTIAQQFKICVFSTRQFIPETERKTFTCKVLTTGTVIKIVHNTLERKNNGYIETMVYNSNDKYDWFDVDGIRGVGIRISHPQKIDKRNGKSVR